MKIGTSKRILSAFLALVTVFLMMPLSLYTVFAENEEYKNDYTPFLIESANDKSVYNANTADMLYEFYLAARGYIDDYAGDKLYSAQDGDFTFRHNGNSYAPESVYFSKPQEYPSCGLLTGIFNFEINGTVKHIAMIAFRGSDKFEDWVTDAAIVTGKDGYHEGFEETAERHYNAMKNGVSYSLGNGETISFSDFLDQMNAGNDDYTMIVTGHSLGAAVAGVFTSKHLDNVNGITANNVVAYTFASPLTCSSAQAAKEAGIVKNVFNLVNTDDIVTKVGADVASGKRTGYDLKMRLGKYDSVWQNLDTLLFDVDISKLWDQIKKTGSDIGDNHHMSTAYLPTKNYISSHINAYLDNFVLYDHYDKETDTYQRIVYNNSNLKVYGNGQLSGEWSKNALIEWEKVKDNCTSLVFDANCKITAIGDYAFSGMSNLTNELVLPDTITEIGKYAFFHCGFDGDLLIPGGMMTVGTNAFNGCSNLDRINAKDASSMTWGYGAFANCVDQRALLLPVEDSGTDLTEVFKTYYVQDNNGSYSIYVKDATSGNIVLPNDKIYIGRIEDDKLNVRPHYDFHYLLTTGHTDTADNIKELATNTLENVATVDKSGCITVSNNCQSGTEFTVVVMDNYEGNPDYEVYNSDRFIHFTVGTVNNNFAGGIGTEDRPYLINNSGQLERINNDLSAHYKLIANIDFTGEESWDGIGNSDNPFKGVIDGAGYTIANLKGAMFITASEGTIKNLNISKWSIESGSNISAILTGENKEGGKIINCHIDSSVINISYSYNSGDCWHNVGGFAGFNRGEISNSSITNTTLKGYAHGGDGHYNVHLNIGGIAARNSAGGSINSCASYDNTVYGYIYHNGIGGVWYDDDKSWAYFELGGVVGWAHEGSTVSSTYYYENAVSRDRSYYDHNAIDDGEYALLGAANLSSGIGYSEIEGDCVENALRENVFITQSAVVIENKPHKTHYYIGESLNLYGLVLRDDLNDIVNGYTVDGFSSNKSGTQEITVTYNTGYGTFTDTFDITVENIIPETVIVKPKKERYNINDSLTVEDFTATVYYNNGTAEVMESLAENESNIVKFTAFTSDLNGMDTQTIQLNYHYAYMTSEGKAAASTSILAYTAVIVKCDCMSTTINNAKSATLEEYGYTGDIICDVCRSVVEEGVLIDILECVDHNYTDWTKYDDTQHSRVCECGEIEYADHNLDSGRVILEPSYTNTGIMMYTCIDCKAEITEEIPIIEHTPGDINGDGVVNSKDTTRLMRYLAGWDVEVNEAALDVNGDGEVNTKDTTRLMRYLAGWDVEIY